MSVISGQLRSLSFKLVNVRLGTLVYTSRLVSHDVRQRRREAPSSNRSKWSQYGEEDVNDLDPVEAGIEAVIKEEQKRMKTVKFHKLKRQMRPKGAPERKLSWEAIQQIRFLKQESPEEWSLERLAEGFSVTPDEISRVLASKFTPSRERMLKQDAKVLSKQQQWASLPGGPPGLPKLIPQSPAQNSLPPGAAVPLVASGSQALKKMGGKREVDYSRESTALTVKPHQVSSSLTEGPAIAQDTHAKGNRSATDENTMDNTGNEAGEYSEEDEGEEVWDGITFSDTELQEIASTMAVKSTPVLQKGREYFDTDGNFLYRI